MKIKCLCATYMTLNLSVGLFFTTAFSYVGGAKETEPVETPVEEVVEEPVPEPTPKPEPEISEERSEHYGFKIFYDKSHRMRTLGLRNEKPHTKPIAAHAIDLKVFPQTQRSADKVRSKRGCSNENHPPHYLNFLRWLSAVFAEKVRF